MKEHILVVDDEPQIRELLSLYLANHGYRVSTTANSEETLQMIRETPLDLVVLDIGLAEEDGLNLLVRLKDEHPKQRVIMLTGMGFVEDLLHEAYQKGADGYVSKVLPLDELLLTIEKTFKSPDHPTEVSC
jgi:DNA-binding response OmpR family regulator